MSDWRPCTVILPINGWYLQPSQEMSMINKNIAANVSRGSWVVDFSRNLNREGIWGEWDWHEAYIHPEICLNITVYMDIDFGRVNTYRIIIEESPFVCISLFIVRNTGIIK